MTPVEDYAAKERLKFLRGMCFNNAATIIAGKLSNGAQYPTEEIAQRTFKMAKALLDEAKRIDFNNWE